jgi:hypothetical protein
MDLAGDREPGGNGGRILPRAARSGKADEGQLTHDAGGILGDWAGIGCRGDHWDQSWAGPGLGH